MSSGTTERNGGDGSECEGTLTECSSLISLKHFIGIVASTSEFCFEIVFSSSKVYSSSSAAEVFADSLQISSIMDSMSYGLFTDSLTMDRKLVSPESPKL